MSLLFVDQYRAGNWNQSSWLSLTPNVNTSVAFNSFTSVSVDLHWPQQNHWFQKVVCGSMAESHLKKIQMSKFRPAMTFVSVKASSIRYCIIWPLWRFHFQNMTLPTLTILWYLKMEGFPAIYKDERILISQRPVNGMCLLVRSEQLGKTYKWSLSAFFIIRQKRCWVLVWRQALKI